MPDRILIPLIVACALFMQNLDSTVVATALPAIAADFGSSPIHLKLALTTYLLTIAVFLPASGWMADTFGARLVFRVAILVFTVGSVMCGLARSVEWLVIARIVQGLGGAMMVPVGRLVVLRSVSKSELVAALSWLTIPGLAGPVLGPPVGGFLTTYASWPWIFWINVPVGILGIVLASFYIPDIREERHTNFDWVGFAQTGFGLALLMFGSTTLGLNLLPLTLDFLIMAVGAALLFAYVKHTRRISDPILNLALFRIPSFRHSIVGATIFRLGLGASPFLLPLLLQLGFGMTAFASGLITFSSAAGALVMKFTAPLIIRLFGFKRVLIVNTLLSAVFIALPAFFTPATPASLMIGLLLVGGFFRSLQFTATNALTFADVTRDEMSQATVISSVAQQIAMSAGITVGAIVLQITVSATGGEITASSFWPAFLAVGITTLISVLPYARLEADAGQEMSGHQRRGVAAAAPAATGAAQPTPLPSTGRSGAPKSLGD